MAHHQYHLIQNHHHHHRPNRISLPQRTTTTTANPNTPTISRLYPIYPIHSIIFIFIFNPIKTPPLLSPFLHLQFQTHRHECLSLIPIAASDVDLWTLPATTHDSVASNLLCFFRVTAVRFWEKFCDFNFCLGALKMEENGKELKFEYCVFFLLENKTHSYTFWNRKVFVFGGFSGFEFLKF